MFTVDNIKKQYEVEKKIMAHKDYTKFCQATSLTDPTCSATGFASIAL